ncbi:MAG TPA: TspO/MBR family protein [Longimicrobiales bacterium]|nr:TspO/MBR family protein [Longimicrobiales bacterium]
MSNPPRPGGLLLQLVNVVVLVAVLWMNGLAGSGALSGESIGLIANRYRSTFLPANWVFGIWSLIYLSLTLFTAYQALPAQRGNEAIRRIGWGWAVNGALNIAWVTLFSFALFGPALAVMLALLVNLVWIVERTGWPEGRLGWVDRVLVAYPFGLYLAWISVAVIANTFQYLTYLEWGGFGISPEVWSAIMMVVGTGLAAFMVVHRGNWLFPLVFAWAFWGIADRFADIPVIANTAYAMIGVGLGFLVGGMLWRRRRRGGATG